MKKYIKQSIGLIAITGFAVGISSCSNTRFLDEGQFLYMGSEIEIKGDSLNKKESAVLKSKLEEKINLKPNSSFLGLRPRLYIYNITGEPKKQKGWKYWLKYKVGEKPVLLSQSKSEFNKDLLVNYAENKGYFNANAVYDTVQKNKKATVHYTVYPAQRYVINKIQFPTDTAIINKEIAQTQPNTLLKVGEPFDLDQIKAERERIDTKLKEKGFYYFHHNNLIVQADSTSNKKHQVDLFIKLKDDTPYQSTEQFTINKVVVFPNYNMRDVHRGLYQIPMSKDSLTQYNNGKFYLVDPHKTFKPKVFNQALAFEEGDLYNRTDHNLTLNRLINLGVFKFVKNEFKVADSINHSFDSYYLLTPKEFQSLRLEVLGRTNSANYGGGELNLNWTHRNIFKGVEQLKMALYGALDVQLGGPKDANNIFRAGFNTQLSIPRIVAPFKFHSSSAYMPRTNIGVGYEYQSRTSLYTLHNFNSSFGYVWKENARKEHDLKILDATLVFPERISNEYHNQIYDENGNVINPNLKRVVDKQLIFGPTYAYTYTTTMLPKPSTFYYRGIVDLSANVTGLLSGANTKNGKEKTLFNIPYSQYAKMEHDVRFYHKFSPKTSIATRFIGGLAYPYGNSEFVPFSKQFFVGGSNSIRAFRARTLGPGSYDPRQDNANFFFDKSGDIKLELNAELRQNLFSFLNLALFVDAGNIWLINDDELRPGGKFSNDFLNEFAVGAGIGLRFDFSILVFRTDFAIPLRIPYYEKGNRWAIDEINFGDKKWRKDNLIMNIAIGYPF